MGFMWFNCYSSNTGVICHMNNSREEFIKVLQSNDKSKLKEWLANNGKSPKPTAAVMFEKKEEKDNNEA